MKLGKVLFLTLLMIVGLLSGCSSVEDESKETVTSVETAFNAQPEKANSENGEVSFYLPSTMKIEKKDKNNVILQKDNQTFILFINPIEERTSDVLYKEIVAKEFAVDKTYTGNERYGYVKAFETKDKLYLVTVGIGGIKMTTEVKLGDMSENASEMMKIVSSVQY
ncbi:hypothetical protein V7112_21485 [Bacillus sp. JJ1566]|uniref:hypothetical protein n=1 Tax=Bacillus sp. JJ1566 TaxID=3122961 RepID=UPI002FFDA9C0